MNKEQILNELKNILNDGDRFIADIPIDTISLSSKIIDDLAMDSIQIMDLLVEIEEYFHIVFDFEKINAENILTIDSIIDMIMESKELK